MSTGVWARSSHVATAVFASAVIALLALYAETALSMVSIWYRSATFNHGFVVLPISLWLVWKRREHLANLPLSTTPWVLPLIALTAFGWLLGDLAGVNAVTQFALVALLVLLVPTILGMPVARAIMFPLGFLFFMVPVGDFALPTMMDWTAEFTVTALRATGIPVYQEGRHFVLPSGRWSVVEACSGVRYLIASTCVGMLFAYINYTSMRRRIAFTVVAILVPIVANWIRAYLIVLLGHLSNGKIAAGVDHLIYGWVFFGVVIAIMFMIGARWAEPEAAVAAPIATGNRPGTPGSSRSQPIVAVAAAVVFAAPLVVLSALERTGVASTRPTLSMPEVPKWARSGASTGWLPAFEGADAQDSATYLRDGRQVGMHVFYYRNQSYDRKLVSSVNELVKSEDKDWVPVVEGKRIVASAGPAINVRTTQLRGAGGDRMAAWHWYWINGHLTTSDHKAKLLTAVERLRGRGDDSSVVIVSTPGTGPDADATLESFLKDAAGPIAGALEQTRAAATGSAN